MKYEKSLFIDELKATEERNHLSTLFLIQSSSLGMDKNGKPFMNLVFQDKTGDIEGRIWEDAHKYAGVATRDAFVLVEGKTQSFQGRRQVVVKKLQVVREDEVDPRQFVKAGSLDVEELYRTLLEFVDSMQDPHCRELADRVLRQDEEVVRRLKVAPAAKSIHHAYPGGLLEHIVSVSRILDFLAGHYRPHVSRDLLLLGGFFHDICKLWELSYERLTDYTTEGRLIGHLVMGLELVDRHTAQIPGFPDRKKLLIKHVLLSHHGEIEYGSPRRPKTLEAILVHQADYLDSKFNSAQAFIQNDKTVGEWTALNREAGRYFLKTPFDLSGSGSTAAFSGER